MTNVIVFSLYAVGRLFCFLHRLNWSIGLCLSSYFKYSLDKRVDRWELRVEIEVSKWLYFVSCSLLVHSDSLERILKLGLMNILGLGNSIRLKFRDGGSWHLALWTSSKFKTNPSASCFYFPETLNFNISLLLKFPLLKLCRRLLTIIFLSIPDLLGIISEKFELKKNGIANECRMYTMLQLR